MYEVWRKKPDQYFRLSTFAISVVKKHSYERIAQLFKTMFLEVSKTNAFKLARNIKKPLVNSTALIACFVTNE